jgi:lysine 2,3-aminomutase
MLVTTQCASYCRYCTRSRIVGDPSATFSREEFELQLDYLKRTPQVRDVLLSGGDPLVLAPRILEEILSRLREIPHIEITRIGSRVPVFLPMRVTDELTDMLQKYHPFWLNIHVNHPNEISAELEQACDRLTRAGIPLGNQAVLLAGVNDNVHIQRQLVQELTRIRVRPYYMYQCDLVEGAGHLRTPVAKGIEIMEGLRGHTSGFSVHQYIIDAPGGGGKIPVSPNYLLSMSDHKIILRNYEGYITTYEEPVDYLPSQAAKYKGEKRPEPGQSGVTGLLEGDQIFIKPEGFDQVHDRGGIQHRLKDESKWVPLGIGPGGDEGGEEGDEHR